MFLFIENKNNKIKDKENFIFKEIFICKLVLIFKIKMYCFVEFFVCVFKFGDDLLKYDLYVIDMIYIL